MEIRIPYGKSFLTANLPDDIGVDVIEPPEVSPAVNPLEVVQSALDNLLGDVDWENFTGSRSVAIAVNDKTGDIRPEERRIEQRRQVARHREGPRVPSDMRRKSIVGEAERLIVLRNAIRGVIANNHEGSGTFRIFHDDRTAMLDAHPAPAPSAG
ncbi:MAG: lactate racemase domain-containing protein, partial [Anaerolineales bacterium]|nr:lactate racemase domain-containing protein [Anaerolineales bacterium]